MEGVPKETEQKMPKETIDALQKARQTYLPTLPSILRNLHEVGFFSGNEMREDEKIKALLPLTSGQPFVRGEKGEKREHKSLQIGVVFSGGQAPGGHNVITGIYDALKLLNSHSKLFGFLEGPGGIVKAKSRELTAEDLAPFRNQGGFDLIGSGRTKIETEEQLGASLATVTKMGLDGLIIIGGDDSNTNAALLAEYFMKKGSPVRVIGVPKTIDGDLKNEHVEISFGFDTACKVYSEIIGNIARDAQSAKKYYHFIKLMGRSASHIVLECALVTHPNLAFIGEEIAQHKKTLKGVVDEIADLVCKRAELGKNFGVILIPEGLIEVIPECGILIGELNHILLNEPQADTGSVLPKLSSASRALFSTLPKPLQEQLLLKRDSHGNVEVSKIETETLLMELVGNEIESRVKQGSSKAKFSPLRHFLGYEGRAGYPSNFDCNYCYALGFAAALLAHHGFTSYMACVSNLIRGPQEWGIGGVPLTTLMNLEMRKGKEKPVIQKKLVELDSKAFMHFAKFRKQWGLQDEYCFPGPIQFFGGSDFTEQIPLTLLLDSSCKQ